MIRKSSRFYSGSSFHSMPVMKTSSMPAFWTPPFVMVRRVTYAQGGTRTYYVEPYEWDERDREREDTREREQDYESRYDDREQERDVELYYRDYDQWYGP